MQILPFFFFLPPNISKTFRELGRNLTTCAVVAAPTKHPSRSSSCHRTAALPLTPIAGSPMTILRPTVHNGDVPRRCSCCSRAFSSVAEGARGHTATQGKPSLSPSRRGRERTKVRIALRSTSADRSVRGKEANFSSNNRRWISIRKKNK